MAECKYCNTILTLESEHEIINLPPVDDGFVVGFVVCPSCWVLHTEMGGTHTSHPNIFGMGEMVNPGSVRKI